MNRVTRGTVVLAAALAALSCKGDPTDSLRNGIDHLVADRTELFVRPDTTKSVQIEAVDEQGNAISTDFKLTTSAGAFTVVEDSSFNIVYDAKGNATRPSPWIRARYLVKGVSQFGSGSFTVSAGGKSLVIPVRIQADTATSVTLSTTTPNVGDTVTATVGTGFRFSALTRVTIAGAGVATLGFSADTTQVYFVVGPGANAAPSFSNLVLAYALPVGGYTASTGGVVLTTAGSPPLTASATNAAVGDTITLTAPAPYRFTPASKATVGTAGLANLGPSADSLTFQFVIGPGAVDTIQVSNLEVSGAPSAGTFTLKTATTLTTPVITNFPATYSLASPNGYPNPDTVTVTVGAGFKFLPNATVKFGTTSAFIVSHSTDSTQIRFIPVPGQGTTAATVDGVVLGFLTSVRLALPTAGTINTPAASGAQVLATAPTIAIPATGVTSVIRDIGIFAAAPECGNIGFHCLFYKIVLAAPATFNVSITWGNTADLGGYFIDAAGNDQFGDFACDNFGSGAGGQPEHCSQTLPAGTWYLALADFTSAAPQNTGTVTLTLTGQ